MGLHVYGAYWMAYGLFAPDERAWLGGAQALQDARMLPVSAPDALDDAVHALASKVASTSGPDARADLLGELLASSAPCHQQLPR